MLRSVSERFDTSISCLHAMNDRVMIFLKRIAPRIISFPQTESKKQLKADKFKQVLNYSKSRFFFLLD